MKKLIWALVFWCLPSAAFADEETDAARSPRMGIELGAGFGYSFWWREGYRNGSHIQPGVGFGVLEEHGGAMLRLSGGTVTSKLLNGEKLERTLNMEALVWMPWAVGRDLSAYLAAGPLLQWAGSETNLQVLTGAVFETGVDLLTILDFVRFRYGVRTHLTSAGADAVVLVGTTFWSWPL